MRLNLRWVFALVASVALAMAVAACGDDSDSSSESESGSSVVPKEFQPVTEAPDNAQPGGELKVLNAGDIDYMDPGAAYYQSTYEVTEAGHRPLLGWQPADLDKPSPDFASEEPEISEDGQTITFHLNDNVFFSPPVDREATSKDVKYALERTTLPGVGNQYIAAYASDIVGYEEAAKEAIKNPTGGAPDIEGIETPDDKTLVINMNEPKVASADVIAQMVALPSSAPVPEEYAKEFDAKNPSLYGQYVSFTGPYMVQNDCVDEEGNEESGDCTGELIGYTPSKEIHMVRNPNWDGDASNDFRPAYLDTITIEEGFEDTASASRKILEDSATVSGDFPPPPNVLKEAAQDSEPEQLQLPQLAGYRHIALNTQEPPFDDINVRKAVIANSDREALRNTRGGELVGQVATHYINPGFPGFEEGGGLEGPDLDFIKDPNGDPELAAEYMKKAGFDSGKCEGSDCEITMVGDNIPPGKDTAEVFKGQLEDLGFKVSFQPVDHTIMYTRFCSVPEQQPEVCPNVGWIPDFRDPQAMLDVPFYGPNIDPENNSNWPQLDDPEVNKAIEDARTVEGDSERAQAWGEVDQLVSSKAPAVPWIWENFPLVQSTDVAGVVNLQNASWDFSFTSLK